MHSASPDNVVANLQNLSATLSTQLRKAALWSLENPNEFAFNTIRFSAAQAGVHPNSFTRLAKIAGYRSFKELKQAFLAHQTDTAREIRKRADLLQNAGKNNYLHELYKGFASASITNAENLFANNEPEQIKRAADIIVRARQTYVFGVGTSYALAHNFSYVANMAMDNVTQIPRPGNLPLDELSNMHSDDVLVLFSFHPYRSDVLKTLTMAREQGAHIISITDKNTSPVALTADHTFITPVDSPHFFTSLMAAYALVETLLGFMVADTGKKAAKRIEEFHQRRYESGIYIDDQPEIAS